MSAILVHFSCVYVIVCLLTMLLTVDVISDMIPSLVTYSKYSFCYYSIFYSNCMPSYEFDDVGKFLVSCVH